MLPATDSGTSPLIMDQTVNNEFLMMARTTLLALSNFFAGTHDVSFLVDESTRYLAAWVTFHFAYSIWRGAVCYYVFFYFTMYGPPGLNDRDGRRIALAKGVAIYVARLFPWFLYAQAYHKIAVYGSNHSAHPEKWDFSLPEIKASHLLASLPLLVPTYIYTRHRWKAFMALGLWLHPGPIFLHGPLAQLLGRLFTMLGLM